jgi:hypothetical protein
MINELAAEGLRRAKLFKFFWDHEFDTPIRTEVPLRRRLDCWRHGFLTESGVLYDLDAHGTDEYLNDIQYLDQWQVNREAQVFTDHKLAFRELLQHTHGERLPALHGVLRNGRVSDGRGTVLDADLARWLRERARAEGRLVCKPEDGSGGHGVFLVSDDGESVTTNGKAGVEPVLEAVSDGTVYLAVEYVEQARYTATIYPHSVNTVRILTLWDYERGEPYVADAIHRIGTDDSQPVDNWDQGGLSVSIDLDTGTLGRATRYPDTTTLEWFEEHPDTGAPITGVGIRAWESIATGVREMADRFWYVPMIAWDVVATDDGYRIIEANGRPTINMHQVHRPLLRDDRTRRFFEHHGILS